MAGLELILASGSPRRRALLETLGLAHRVVPADVSECPEAGEPAAVFAERAARDKAAAVAETAADAAVLAADTVVEIEGEILGKPCSDDDARRMLGRLGGRKHRVHTGVALMANGRVASLVDTTTVRFADLDRASIDWYVASGEPRDKAGAYAVQGRGGVFVTAVEGSPHTVVGLPLHRLPELFAACGLDLFALLHPERG